jgi:peptidoglycan/LPS O-acetylase OafA/YrhL
MKSSIGGLAMPEVRIPAVVAPDRAAARAAGRAGWMDTLRVTVIAGVIVLHAATAYLLDIDWYYQERTTSTHTPALLAFPALLAGLFGLGPLFLVGGLLSAGSLARKGPGRFARGRLVRLGVPLLAFVALIDPLTDYLGSLAEGEHPRLWPYLVDQTGTRDAGPLWFVALLLLLSLAYAAVRRLRPVRVGGAGRIDLRHLVAVAAGIGVGSFMVRLGSPLGAESFANLRWEAWPQGIGLFTLGVLAGERGWLEGLDRRLVGRCGWLAMAGALALVALVADRLDAEAGGWTWPAAAVAVLEGSVAVALSLWEVAWFRRRWDRPGRLVQRAGRGSYGAYVLHPPVLVVLSLLVRPLAVAPEAKFLLIATTGVVAAFAVGIGVTTRRRAMAHLAMPR